MSFAPLQIFFKIDNSVQNFNLMSHFKTLRRKYRNIRKCSQFKSKRWCFTRCEEAAAVAGAGEGDELVSTADADPQQVGVEAGAGGDGDRTEDQVTDLLDDERVAAELLSRLADQGAPSLDDVANIPDDTPLLQVPWLAWSFRVSKRAVFQSTEEAIVGSVNSGLKQLEVTVEVGLKQLEIQVEESQASNVPLTTSGADQQPAKVPSAVAQGELALPDDHSHSQQVESTKTQSDEILVKVENVMESLQDEIMASGSLKPHGEVLSVEILTADSATKDLSDIALIAKIEQDSQPAVISANVTTESPPNNVEEIIELSEVGQLSPVNLEEEKEIAEMETKTIKNRDNNGPEVIEVESSKEPVKKVSFAQSEVAHKKSSVVKTKIEPTMEEVTEKKLSIQKHETLHEEFRKESSTTSQKKVSVQDESAKQGSKKFSRDEKTQPSSESTGFTIQEVPVSGAEKIDAAAAFLSDQSQSEVSPVSALPEEELPPFEVVEGRKASVERELQVAPEEGASGGLVAENQGDAQTAPRQTEPELQTAAKTDPSYIDVAQHKQQVASGYVSLSEHKEPQEVAFDDAAGAVRSKIYE